ncbi:MAG TPA: sulfatase-like hydrolase/transferase [Chitinophagaceae bacterium]|jgi:hypothetical protein|nr:sulfatase-like hydrolase/transferase [Chitinophagaceae bacterium]
MAYHFFFGAIHDAIKNLLGNIFITKYSFILPVTLILFALIFLILKKSKRKLNRFTTYVNILFLVLIFIDLVSLIIKQSKSSNQADQETSQQFTNCGDCSKPDIYLIVADEYASNIQLKTFFDFDNSHFENNLVKRGFEIIKNSKSNYNCTPFSIASMLDMDYIGDIKNYKFDDNSLNSAYRLINKNSLTIFLHKLHYEIKNYSIFNFDNKPVLASSPYSTSGKDLITSQTFLGRLNRDIRFNLITRLGLKSEMGGISKKAVKRNNYFLLKVFEESKLNTSKSRFIYLHVMAPHFPYALNKNGNFYDDSTLFNTTRFDKTKYLEYLEYSNKLFLNLIDQILSQKKKPVIIFIGDHGFRQLTSAQDSASKYHFMNMNAIYLPNKNYSKFYDSMSLVNEFRILLNTEFNQNLQLRRDSTVFLQNWW